MVSAVVIEIDVDFTVHGIFILAVLIIIRFLHIKLNLCSHRAGEELSHSI